MERRQLLAGGWAGLAVASMLGGAQSAVQAATAPKATSGMVVEAVQMPAWTTRAGQRRPLSPGDIVASAQEVETDASAGVVLRLPEGSYVRLGEKTRLGVQRLEVSTESGNTAVRSELKVFDGFFRFATSAVAKIAGQRQIDVTLRTATIGIRGTDFWSMTDKEHDAACLFEGRIELATRDQGALVLDKPTAFWARFFDQPVKPVGVATPDELAKFLKSTELQPGQGVAIASGRWRVVAAALAADNAAAALARTLREAGYPAVIKVKDAEGKKVHEVRINGFATREDAQVILSRLAGISGVNGRVALSA